MKIVLFEIEEWEREPLQKLFGGGGAVLVQAPLTAGNAADYAGAEVISSFISSSLDRTILEKLPKLRLIATRSTGFDHIDLDYCNAHNIAVANVPAYGEHTVAEHVFALLLALSRHIPEAAQRTRDGNFNFHGLQGFDLYGKTFGIIGTGHIGRRAAQIAKGFGMKVIAFDMRPQPAEAEAIGFAYVDFSRLLAESDIISLHVPATPQTRHLLSDKEFAAMKQGVVIINTARGVAIDVKALLQALASGKVGAAGLDVLPEEPAIREETELLRQPSAGNRDLQTLLIDHALMHHRNVIVTPHSAFYTKEALDKIIGTTAENISAFLENRPQNIVNPSPQRAGN
ncbi:MAG: hydroxyacid dehydrogenase [Alphaproteobacteria bacterium]|nr:hydroxyacid dehydrogenase [Alphaproteobacteria bacterium]